MPGRAQHKPFFIFTLVLFPSLSGSALLPAGLILRRGWDPSTISAAGRSGQLQSPAEVFFSPGFVLASVLVSASEVSVTGV